MAPARPPAQGGNIGPLLIGGSIIAAGAATWFGYPGLVLIVVGFAAAAFAAPPALLTGRKDSAGYPTAASAAESKAMNRYRMWSELRFKLLIPGKDWLPGWPMRLWWIVAVLLAAAAATLPTPSVGDVGRAVDAISLFHVLVTMNGALRRWTAPDDLCPGPTHDFAIKHVARGGKGIATAAGAVIFATVVFLGVLFALDLLNAGKWLGSAAPWMLALPLALAAAVTVIAVASRGAALETWRTMVRVRGEWAPRWEMVKIDPIPRLLNHEEVGSIQIDTFETHPTVGALAIYPLVDRLASAIGTGIRLAIVESPDLDSQGQPMEGTKHPLRVRIMTFNSDDMPDVNSPDTDQQLVELYAAAAMAWTADQTGIGRWVLLGVEPLHNAPAGEGGGTAAWASAWAQPDGPDMKYFRESCGGTFGANIGAEALVEHRDTQWNGLFFGSLTQGTTDFADPRAAKAMHEIQVHDTWVGRWTNILKMGAVQPRPEHAVYAEATLNGATLYRQPFVVQQGMDPLEFYKLESKISTTLTAAPFVAVTGFSAQGDRPGERHPQAFCITWSDRAMPSNPDKLAPERGDGPKWVLAGRINEAFDAARLARPEVVHVKPLTDTKSQGHIWEIRLRLYGGVTLAEVRGAAQKMRQHLGSEWLRVAQAPDGCTIVAGVNPRGRRVVFARPDKAHRDMCTSLDWEQAFADAKVIGQAGVLPKLSETATLPHNDQVQVLDFTLPAGTSRGLVREAVEKLKAATANAFVEVRESPMGASHFRLLVSETNPLPERVGFNWEAIDDAGGRIPFATGIDGEPVVFDPVDNPHSLLAGVTGAGKSVLAQAFLYGAAVHGAELYVVDPVKGGADFAFVKDYARAFAQTPFEAQAVMKAVYAEVVRRKNANAAAGVGSFMELTEPPPRIFVMIDEFTSLMGQDQVPPASDDSEAELEREAIIASNRAKIDVGVLAGKIAREARSAGVHLLLGTQKLSAKMLDTIPGANDLKTNLARTILGKTSSGDRMSALRAFQDAPELEGDIPKGRGLYEPLTSTAVAMQVWYAAQDELRAQLAKRRTPLPDEQRLDMTPFMPKQESSEPRHHGRTESPSTLPPEEVTVGEFVFTLDGIDEEDPQPAEPEPPAPPALSSAVSAEPQTAYPEEGPAVSSTLTPEPQQHALVAVTAADPLAQSGRPNVVVLPDRGEGLPADSGWWKLDLVLAACADADARELTWVDPDLAGQDELGIPLIELARDTLALHGIHSDLNSTPASPVEVPQPPARPLAPPPAPLVSAPPPAPAPASVDLVPKIGDEFAEPVRERPAGTTVFDDLF